VIVGAARRVAERAEDRAGADWVDAAADAVRRHDLSACAALVHDDVRARVDGDEVASGAAELLHQLDDVLHGSPPDDDWFRVVDRHVAGDDVYVLFAATPDAATAGASSRRRLGYAIVQVRDGRCVAADCFLDAPRPETDAVGAAPVLDLRGPEPVVDLRAAEPRTERREPRDGTDGPAPADAAAARETDDDEAPARAPDDAAAAREADDDAERPAPRGWRRLALPLAALASWVVQDLLLATPVVAFAAHVGTVEAFLAFAPLYAALSLVLSLLTVRLLRRGATPRRGRLARWLGSGDHHPLAMRLLRAGGVLGFGLSSYLLSGPPTVWALHRFAVRRDLVRCAILASVIWGVTFVLSYLVVAELVLL
jgi:hypothetical protein